MNADIDYFQRFNNISLKLKKRFLRKPNHIECSSEFESLSKHLENEEQCYEFAALFSAAQAKCENSAGNSGAECSALLHAAKLHLTAERELQSTCSVSIHENLDMAVSCFQQAAHVFEKDSLSVLASRTLLQLASSLIEFHKFAEACQHLEKASILSSSHSMLQIVILQRLVYCQIMIMDYHCALSNCTRMQDIIQKVGGYSESDSAMGCLKMFDEHMTWCEISRFLLLCIIQKYPDRLELEHVESLEKYSWLGSEEAQPVPYLSNELFLLFQSLLDATQMGSVSNVEAIHEHLYPLLDEEQNYLVYMLAEELKNPFGQNIETPDS